MILFIKWHKLYGTRNVNFYTFQSVPAQKLTALQDQMCIMSK